MADLKTCPFCGSAPELRSSHGWHAVGCNTTKCPAHIYVLVHRSEADAVKTWNTRSAGEAPASHLLGELWCAFGDYEGRLIALPEYAAASERAVKEKIVEAARREGFTGTAEYRMAALGWTILRVAPAAGVLGNERRKPNE